MIQGDARTHATSFGPSVTPHSTDTNPSPPSNPLRIRDHRTRAASSTSDATPGAMTRAVHTSSTPSRLAFHPTAVWETVTPPATHDASSMLTSSAGHTGTISADMQSVDDVSAVSPQPISIAPPARAVVRISHVKDDPRLTEPLADMTIGTTLASASSKDSADLHIFPTHAVPPSPSLPISVPGSTIPQTPSRPQPPLYPGPTTFLQGRDHSQQTTLPWFSRSNSCQYR